MRGILITMAACVLCAMLSVMNGAEKDAKAGASTNRFPPEVLAFCASKEQQVRRVAGDIEIPTEVTDFFRAARKGDWKEVDELLGLVRGLPSFDGSEKEKALGATISGAALEVVLAMEPFEKAEPKYAMAFGRDIIASMPKGSIYFGGTDPGRGLVTALSTAHDRGEPVFTIAQNALADGRYLRYLRTMYEGRIYTPTDADSSRAFSEYISDAQKRLEHDQKFPNEPRQVKPGEDIQMANGRARVGGQMAVIAIYGRLAKTVFDQNPAREFYVEESFPLDWMYPHLSPNGLIMKINRKPLDAVTPAMVEADQKYWSDQLKPMIGPWLQTNTSVKEICVFAEKVLLDRNLTNFSGDPKFVQNEYACKMYSKARSSIGGLYAWRINQAKTAEEKALMEQAADFAFRQALALRPDSPEVVFRYVNLLVSKQRFDDAILIVETSGKFGGNENFRNLVTELRRMSKAQNNLKF